MARTIRFSLALLHELLLPAFVLTIVGSYFVLAWANNVHRVAERGYYPPPVMPLTSRLAPGK